MNNILVSIIVPVYKVEMYLEQCVNSLCAQTYTNIEIILIDDGSPDECPKLCDAFASKDSRVFVIHQENCGAALARKAGLERATGRYVVFCDGDDWLDEDTIAVCVDVAERDQADCVMFGYVREYPEKSIDNPLFPQSFSYDIQTSGKMIHRHIIGPIDEELREPHKLENLSSFGMKLYRKEIAERGRFVSERVTGTSEDTIFNIYALESCRISCINRCMYHYRKSNPQSITTAHKPDLADKWDAMYNIILEYIENSKNYRDDHTPYLNRVACGMIGLGLNEVASPENFARKVKKIRLILSKPLYRKAFQQFDISYCDFKWKVFFILCKTKSAFLLTLMLKSINYFRSRVVVKGALSG